jgi:predicted DNA-binding protein
MAYDDRSHLHDQITRVRLDQDTDDLLRSLAKFHRTQKAVLARELLEASLRSMLSEVHEYGTKNTTVA